MTPEQVAAAEAYLADVRTAQAVAERGVVSALGMAILHGDARSPVVGEEAIARNRAGIENHERKLEWLASINKVERVILPQHLQPGPTCYRVPL